jgi:pimeloyl-ACP methyl ester carboxylesterase
MKRNARWLIGIFVFLGLVFLADSNMQFRMSPSEIDAYFARKKMKGSRHQYGIGDHRTINYLQVGDGQRPLVVFVHGSPGSLSAFIDFMGDPELLQHAELITVDRPGFGDSNFGNAEPSLQKQSEYLRPLVEQNKKGRRVILVGHSLGGPVIARMAMDYPELIDGLILVAASIDPELEPNEKWFRKPLSSPFLKWILPRVFRASNDELVNLKPELITMTIGWAKITQPVIVIQGKKDSLVPPANADFARKMLTNSTAVEFIEKDTMDHFVPWSNPELIRRAIIDMIGKFPELHPA